MENDANLRHKLRGSAHRTQIMSTCHMWPGLIVVIGLRQRLAAGHE